MFRLVQPREFFQMKAGCGGAGGVWKRKTSRERVGAEVPKGTMGVSTRRGTATWHRAEDAAGRVFGDGGREARGYLTASPGCRASLSPNWDQSGVHHSV